MPAPIHEVYVFNATFEEYKIQMSGRMFFFKPRQWMKLPETYLWILEWEHLDKGLFAFRPGDDLKAKEREALIKYLDYLHIRIRNFQSFIDMRNAQDKSTKNIRELKAMTQAEQWTKEIREKLEMESPLDYTPSFLKSEDMGEHKNIFAGLEEAKVVKEQEPDKIIKKYSKKSFNDIDIGSDISVSS